MKLKNSLFSKAIIWNNLRRFWWVSALYTLILFLVSPLITLTKMGNEYITKINFDMIFDGTILLLFVMPVFVAVIVFRYMQNQKSMVTLHAMPFSRLKLYVNNIISGLILLIMPILLNTAFLSYIQVFVETGIIFETGIVMQYLWASLLISITLFVFTVLVGMVTGSSIAQIIFTYIFNFLVPGIIVAINYLLRGVLYGFSGINESIVEKLMLISPIMQSLYLRSVKYTIIDFLITDAIIVVIALILGYILYKFRNLEDAGEVISGKYIKPIFKYGVTTCAMLLGVIYVKEIFNFDAPNLWIYIAFALLGYAIAEMLIRKSFKILNSYKGFIGFVGVFAIIAGCISFDIFGYENYIPKEQDVKSFGIDLPQYAVMAMREDVNEDGLLFDKENIKRIIALNQEMVKNKEKNRYENSDIRISYKLNNGETVNRIYNLNYSEYIDRLDEIYDSKEYKLATNDIFDKKANDIYSIRVSSNVLSERYSLTISDETEIVEMFEAIKQDTLDLSVREQNQYRDLYQVEIMFRRNSPLTNGVTYSSKNATYTTKYISFNKNASNVASFLKSKGCDKRLLIDADNISYINIEKENGSILIKTITDKEEIKNVINYLYGSNYEEKKYYSTFSEMYVMKINFTTGATEWVTFAEDEYPEIVKK